MFLNDTTGFYCFGVGLTAKVQEYFSDYEHNLLLLSHIGDPRYAFLALFPLAYCWDNYLGLKVLWLSSLTEWVNAILKWIARDDRPYWWHSNNCQFSGRSLKQFPITCESGPGFPSGHVMSSSSLGFLLVIYMSKLVKTKIGKTILLSIMMPVYAVLVILVSLSRVFIATHFPHQVIVGAVVGMFMTLHVHTVTSKYSPTIMLHVKSIFVGAALLLIALLLFYVLTILKLNLLSSVDLALLHCKKREWVHVDTTLFFAVVRDVGCLCGISMSAISLEMMYMYRKFFIFVRKNNIKLVSVGSKSLVQKIGSLFLGVLMCVLFTFTERLKIPQENMLLFYFISTLKYMLIVCFVIVMNEVFRIYCKKTKIKVKGKDE